MPGPRCSMKKGHRGLHRRCTDRCVGRDTEGAWATRLSHGLRTSNRTVHFPALTDYLRGQPDWHRPLLGLFRTGDECIRKLVWMFRRHCGDLNALRRGRVAHRSLGAQAQPGSACGGAWDCHLIRQPARGTTRRAPRRAAASRSCCQIERPARTVDAAAAGSSASRCS